MADRIEKMLSSGITPLEIIYFPIKTTSRSELVGLRSVLKINSIEMGALFPRQYGVVANRNAQSVRLVSWVFHRLPKDLANMEKAGRLPNFITMYVPTRMLMNGSFERLVSSSKSGMANYLTRLCIECPSSLLLENTEEAAAAISSLKEKYGLSFMLSEYGDSFCPALRIQGLPFEMVLLDEIVSNKVAIKSVSVRSAIRLINELKMTAVLENANNDDVISEAFSVGCERYISARGRTLDEVIAHA